MKRIFLVISLFIITTTSSSAQVIMLSDTNAVKTIDGIVKEVLKLVSGEKGTTRNWEALRNLFLSTSTFTILNNNDSIPRPVETLSLDDFIDLLHDEYYEKGYLEYELGKTIDQYNGIANVFQSFYGKDSENTEERGINSYQLVYFNKRWWIANMLWTIETKGAKIPQKYLNNKK
jgi:hypothetical protein